MVDASIAQIDAAVAAALEASPPDLFERSRAAAGAFVGVLAGDPRKARVYSEAIGSDALKDRQTGAVNAYAALLASQMHELVDEIARLCVAAAATVA